jgi:hypothetical protein
VLQTFSEQKEVKKKKKRENERSEDVRKPKGAKLDELIWLRPVNVKKCCIS